MNHGCWCTFDTWSKQARLQLPFWARTRPFSRLWIKIRYLIQRNFVFRGKVNLTKQIAWCWHSVWSPASLTSSTACERRLRACWCRTLSITSEPRCSTVTFWCWSSSLSTKSSSRRGKQKSIGQYRIILSADTASEVRQPPERCLSRKAGIMRCCHRNNFRYCVQKPSAVRRGPFCMQV